MDKLAYKIGLKERSKKEMDDFFMKLYYKSNEIKQGFSSLYSQYRSPNHKTEFWFNSSDIGEKRKLVTNIVMHHSTSNVIDVFPQKVLDRNYNGNFSCLCSLNKNEKECFPILFITPDVLPRIDKGEKIKAQICAFALDMEVGINTHRLDESIALFNAFNYPYNPLKYIFPFNYIMKNISNSNYHYDLTDNLVEVRGIIKEVKVIEEDIVGEKSNYLYMKVETSFYGQSDELTICYSDKDNIDAYKPGEIITAKCMIQADCSIYKLDKGAIINRKNIVKLFQDAFESKNFDRVNSFIADDCKYTSESSNKSFFNKNDFLNHILKIIFNRACYSTNDIFKYKLQFKDGKYYIEEFCNNASWAKFYLTFKDYTITEIKVVN